MRYSQEGEETMKWNLLFSPLEDLASSEVGGKCTAEQIRLHRQRMTKAVEDPLLKQVEYCVSEFPCSKCMLIGMWW